MTNKHRDVTKLRSPEAKKRAAENERNSDTLFDEEDLPKPKPVIVRRDKLWQYAEDVVGFILGRSGYHVQRQVPLGRSHGRNVRVDIVTFLPSCPEDKIVVSVKFLRHRGSWDEKIPEEVAKLTRILPLDGVKRGYVVLVGPGADDRKGERWANGLLDTATVKVSDFDIFMCYAGCQEL